jgi:hypothetical protein
VIKISLNARNPPRGINLQQRRAPGSKGESEAPLDAPKNGKPSTLFQVKCRISRSLTKEKKNDRLENNADENPEGEPEPEASSEYRCPN